MKVVRLVCQLPHHPEHQAGPSVHCRVPSPLLVAPRPSTGPAASKPPADGKKETALVAALSRKARTGMADKPKQPSWLRLLPTGGQTPWEGLPQQLRMLLQLPRPPANSLLSLGSWGCLTAAPTPLEEQEESVPITPEQWPEWEHMKKLAQGEWERAALHMALGQLQCFVQNEIKCR